NGERGLLGVAFDPDFASNQFVYVYYTTSTSPAHNRVSRFTASGDVAATGSEVAILEIDNLLPGAVAHNGGALHFGPDGKLYIGVGDNVVTENAQSLSSLKGKLLRINSDGTIPADNPFYSPASGNYRAIWALGLRNPFTFDIQPGTGRVFINDVGSTAFEEINDGIAGANYGWPTCEGKCNPPNPAFRDPIYAYQTTESSCAITGGAFYNPVTARFPSAYFGKYFFADLCAGWIKLVDPSTAAVSDFATISTMAYIVDLDVSADGDLYYLQRGGDGQVRRIPYPAKPAPRPHATPGQGDSPRRSSRDLQRLGLGRLSTELSMAARWRGYCKRDLVVVHDRFDRAHGQWRPFSVRGQQRIRLGNE